MRQFAILLNGNQIKLISQVLNRVAVPNQLPELNDEQLDEVSLLADMFSSNNLDEYAQKDGIINDFTDDAFGLEF